VDGEMMERVFLNIIRNAAQAVGPGGRLEVRGTGGTLTFSDDGPGIAPGEEEAVFERFRRGSASKSSSGTGLGLAIVQTLAQRWGGQASLRARPEGGTRAEIRLPAGEALPSPNPELGEPLGAPS
jgi:signal transduction histidine kinase